MAIPTCTEKATSAGLADICCDVGVVVTVIVKLADTVLAHSSVAVNVKLNWPSVVGVPVIVSGWPLTMPSPSGSFPADTENRGDGKNGVVHAPTVVSGC